MTSFWINFAFSTLLQVLAVPNAELQQFKRAFFKTFVQIYKVFRTDPEFVKYVMENDVNINDYI